MLPKLDELLSYTNLRVVERYKKDYPSNQLPAENALKEVLKYLWLAQKHRNDVVANPHDEALDFPCDVHFEMKEIDDMWHTFILFTKDYMEFGQKFFGKYVHHAPADEEMKSRFHEPDHEIKVARYLSYIYDNLGEETLKVWFAEHLQD